jgi:hypothetical protein
MAQTDYDDVYYQHRLVFDALGRTRWHGKPRFTARTYAKKPTVDDVTATSCPCGCQRTVYHATDDQPAPCRTCADAIVQTAVHANNARRTATSKHASPNASHAASN